MAVPSYLDLYQFDELLFPHSGLPKLLRQMSIGGQTIISIQKKGAYGLVECKLPSSSSEFGKEYVVFNKLLKSAWYV